MPPCVSVPCGQLVTRCAGGHSYTYIAALPLQCYIDVFGVSLAQTVTIDPVGAVTVVEGNNLTITCTDGVNAGNGVGLRENNVQVTNFTTEVNGTARIFQLPVVRERNGNTYRCEDVILGMMSAVMTLTVTCEWIKQLLHSYIYYNLVCGFGRIAISDSQTHCRVAVALSPSFT